MIEIKNVTFGYNKYCNVLQDFSLQFKKGGVYGLLGKNGTGKSTLLYLMMGLLRPKQGEVRIDGVLASKRLPEMMQDIFIVPEEYRNVSGGTFAIAVVHEGKSSVIEGTYDAATGTGSTDPSGIDAEASIANGAHIIYQNTNDSGRDFHERVKSSLKK